MIESVSQLLWSSPGSPSLVSLFLFGLLLGLRHAIEADHVAAVASLATQSRSAKATVRLGVVWGLGHGTTLLLVGGVVVLLGTVIPEALSLRLEWLVGVMLMLLGGDVVRRMLKDRVHFHVHQHDGGVRHFHAHSHTGETGPHDASAHDHSHDAGFPVRALLTGTVHGLAGSAALVLVALATVESRLLGVVYIAVFGIGSVIGMGLLSAIIAVPLGSARALTRIYGGLCGVLGTVTFLVGLGIVYRMTPAILSGL